MKVGLVFRNQQAILLYPAHSVHHCARIVLLARLDGRPSCTTLYNHSVMALLWVELLPLAHQASADDAAPLRGRQCLGYTS